MSGLPGSYCSRDVSEIFSEEQINTAIQSLNPDFFTNSPYLLPLLDMGEIYEYEMSVLSKTILGVSYEGVMPVLVDLLIKSGVDTKGVVPQHLNELLKSCREDPFILKQN